MVDIYKNCPSLEKESSNDGPSPYTRYSCDFDLMEKRTQDCSKCIFYKDERPHTTIEEMRRDG